MTERMQKMMKAMANAGLAHALIHKPENVRYLSGYTGEGCLYIGPGERVILTDFRYVEMASFQAPDFRVVRVGGELRLSEALGLLMGGKPGKVAIEQDHVTVDQMAEIQKALPGAEFAALSGIPESLRMIKGPEEINAISRACEVACKAFDWLIGYVRSGMTEKQVAVELDYAMLRMGSEKAAFGTIACAGPNGSLPHAVPSSRPIGEGELLTLDFGAQVDGYKSDMTRTIAIGEVSDRLRAIYDTVLAAQAAALSAVRPGVRCADVDKVARDFIDRDYQGAFGHSLGHGVGLNIHELPGLSWRDAHTLEPGHVVTVEPGIYLPGVGGCRIEDMGYLTDAGFVNLITAPKHLISIPV